MHGQMQVKVEYIEPTANKGMLIAQVAQRDMFRKNRWPGAQQITEVLEELRDELNKS